MIDNCSEVVNQSINSDSSVTCWVGEPIAFAMLM